MYADDAIRLLINEYSKRADYSNTIFVVTGDHRMIPVNHKNEIDRYHVPLLIYSPLLNTNKIFKSVSSHADIPSTITTYLKQQYQLNFPDSVHWLGKGLTFKTTFSSDKHLAIMRNKGQIADYVFGKYFITDGALQTLGDNMVQTQNRDIKETQKVEGFIQKFQQINEYVCQNDKLYSINFRTNPIEFAIDTFITTSKKEQPKQEKATQIVSTQNTEIKTTASKPVITEKKANPETVRKTAELEAAQVNVSRNPADADAYYNLGIEHLKAGNLSWARANFEKSISLNYKQKKVYLALIDLELMRNDNEAARVYYYKAIGIFSKDELEDALDKIKNHRKRNK
jgi:tetratricopeptide (TPR) repeat protein